MNGIQRIVVGLALIGLPAEAALAGWKTAPHGAATAVAAGALTVTPSDDWNRNSRRPIKKSEVWTLDGETLNELYFVSGLIPGETLFRDADKKNRPLPKLGTSMVLTDLPEFFESSARIALNTSLFELTKVEPTRFGGRDGVKFSYRYSVQGEPLIRRGVASATLIGNQLSLINFSAPEVYYFDRDRPKVEAIMASAKI